LYLLIDFNDLIVIIIILHKLNIYCIISITNSKFITTFVVTVIISLIFIVTY